VQVARLLLSAQQLHCASRRGPAALCIAACCSAERPPRIMQPMNGNVHSALLDFAVREEIDILILGAQPWQGVIRGVLRYTDYCWPGVWRGMPPFTTLGECPAECVGLLRAPEAKRHAHQGFWPWPAWASGGLVVLSTAGGRQDWPGHARDGVCGAAQAAATARARCTSWCSPAASAAPATASRPAASAPA